MTTETIMVDMPPVSATASTTLLFMIQCNKPFITDSSAPMEGGFSKLAKLKHLEPSD